MLGKDINLSCLKEMNNFVLEFAENIVVNYEHAMPSNLYDSWGSKENISIICGVKK